MGRKMNPEKVEAQYKNEDHRLQCGEIYYENDSILFECSFCKNVFVVKDHLFTFIDHLENHINRSHNTDLKENMHEHVNEIEYTADLLNIADHNNDDHDNSIEIILDKVEYDENEEINVLVKEEVIMETMDPVFVDCNDTEIISQNSEEINKITDTSVGYNEIITKSTIYSCPRCDASYDVKSNLYAHWKEKHLHSSNSNRTIIAKQNEEPWNENNPQPSRRKKPITIKIDQKKMNASYKIVTLKETKCDGDSKRVCEICGKELSSRSSLILHMRTHTGEKPHVCSICGKGFACDTNLKSHIRMHLGDKKYKCSFCEKGFVQSSDKKIHERIMHLKDASHVCDVCGRGFYTATRLKYHVQRHTGEKPFQCDTCQNKFYSRTLLNDHMVSHTGLRPFQCNLCEAKFARKKTLKAHERRHKKRP